MPCYMPLLCLMLLLRYLIWTCLEFFSNIETCFHSPQAFLGLEFHCRMDLFELKYMLWDSKELCDHSPMSCLLNWGCLLFGLPLVWTLLVDVGEWHTGCVDGYLCAAGQMLCQMRTAAPYGLCQVMLHWISWERV